MGIGDGIEKAAENAMEDLAGISKPTDDGHVPEPGNPDENIRVHSSISEGSNAADNSDQTAGAGRRTQSMPQDDNVRPADGRRGDGRSNHAGDTGLNSGDPDAGAEAPAEAAGAGEVPRDVPGPAGLPGPDPDELRADPSEGDEDPSAGMGRG